MVNILDPEADLSTLITTVRQRIAANQPVTTDQEEANVGTLQRVHTFLVGRDATQQEIDSA